MNYYEKGIKLLGRLEGRKESNEFLIALDKKYKKKFEKLGYIEEVKKLDKSIEEKIIENRLIKKILKEVM
ncbi:hypothetical protein [Caloranaerobacter sp. DY30410]|uniref:hypothetical protein n=1 Tax=Caloranaerobacter sp. DY30410 TaxID=3238305 RepID=UPI003CFD4547